MKAKKRVFVTGYGSINRIGNGHSLVGESCELEASSEGTKSYSVSQSSLSEYDGDRATRRMDRFTLMAYAAVQMALKNASVEMSKLDAERVGIVMNTCYGPLESTRRYIAKLIVDGAKKVPAAVFPNTVHNAFTGLITIEIKAQGTNSTVSGQNPICYGLDMIREGHDDLMIVGGCDENLVPMVRGFASAGYVDDSNSPNCRTGVFDQEVSAFKLGEGASVLVIESEESMLARGAKPLAEILDYGMANGIEGQPGEAFPIDQVGVEHTIRQALEKSSVGVEQIDYVSAGSNGIPRVAQAELGAIKKIFSQKSMPKMGAVKSILGETLGASSSFSAIAAVESLLTSNLIHLNAHPSASLPSYLSAKKPSPSPINTVLVNSFEMGGTITSLIFRKC